jgi:hypothetical protein
LALDVILCHEAPNRHEGSFEELYGISASHARTLCEWISPSRANERPTQPENPSR